MIDQPISLPSIPDANAGAVRGEAAGGGPFVIVRGERRALSEFDAPGTPIPRLPTLAELERRVIEFRLQLLGGNKSEVARSLGISLKTLYNKLNGYKRADGEGGDAD